MTTVRGAVPADVEGIARVQTRSWQAAYRGYLSDEFLDSMSWEHRLDLWSGAVTAQAHAGNTVLVAVDENAVIGFAALGPSQDDDLPEFFQLYTIYLAPEAWGSGVAADLLAAALGAVPDDSPGVLLWVLTGNDRARRFYERSGFAPDGTSRVETIEGNDFDVVRYVRAADSCG